MCGLYRFILLLGFLQLCSGEEVPCTVSEGNGGTLYSVPQFEGTDCSFYWQNATENVIANHRGKIDGVVVEKTSRTLLLYRCQPLIFYSRMCMSKEGRRRGTCRAPCTSGPDTSSHAEHQPNWTLIVSVTAVALLLVAVFILYILFRNQIAGYCRRTDCFYKPGKIPETPAGRNSIESRVTFSKSRVDQIKIPINY